MAPRYYEWQRSVRGFIRRYVEICDLALRSEHPKESRDLPPKVTTELSSKSRLSGKEKPKLESSAMWLATAIGSGGAGEPV